ncbi:uncharacterized protein LOC109600525 isoform X2 [Aethina tumida]|uniref:uncharacterized protein LOC109600525 isoform X2 n=1 Tax=Aethina tumida TaxID=116153 RepID=UPI0021487CB2|nr:uncharacterized protein LOC109600525 isoform X2 [Aethina tumida]
MCKNMLLRLITFIQLIFFIQARNVCDNNNSFCSNQSKDSEECNINASVISSNECSAINFAVNKVQQNLGDVSLQLIENVSMSFQIYFNQIKWKKCYLKLSDIKNSDKFNCKMYTVASHLVTPLKEPVQDNCLMNLQTEGKSYKLEYKSEHKQEIATKNFIFNIPLSQNFGPQVNIKNRSVFSYVEYTENNILYLNVQPVSKIYNISEYKVEVYRKRDNKNELMDVRMFSGYSEKIQLEYTTYSEEGEYYFAISLINAFCPEDYCFKSVTPEIYIFRRGTPLVIGIVGASFIIPFVLFVFHMISRKYKNNRDFLMSQEKILIMFKPSFESHTKVISSLADLLKQTTGREVILEAFKDPHQNEKICSDRVLYATHILYVPPPSCDSPICEMDMMTYNFLKDEIKKRPDDKVIAIARFHYTTDEIPDVFRGCLSFLLMDEFDAFMGLFERAKKVRQDSWYMELVRRIDLAKNDTDMKRNMPKIIVTEQSDCSDGEFDGLL